MVVAVGRINEMVVKRGCTVCQRTTKISLSRTDFELVYSGF